MDNLCFILRNQSDSVTQIGPGGAQTPIPALTLKRLSTGGEYMASKAHNTRNDSAQYIDPIIVNARLVNLAAEIDRNLAARKALRPMRSDAAKRGWAVRNGR